MQRSTTCMSDAIADKPQVDGTITDKRGYGQRWHFSTRKIDTLLAAGLPHCKVGARRVRILIPEADAWMREKFRVQRIGPAHTTAAKPTDGKQLQP
jgi:hypothetical protein